jgi:hypothetical protein
MMNGNLIPPLLCSLVVFLAKPIIALDGAVFTEESLYVVEDEVNEETPDSVAIPATKPSQYLALGFSLGTSYAPMLWIKKSYYDAFAIPHGIFEGYSPWFYSAQLDIRMGKSDKKTQLRFPLSLAFSRTSGDARMYYFFNGERYDLLPQPEERIFRSHSIMLLDLGTALSFPWFSSARVIVFFVPEIDFVAGFSRIKTNKPFIVAYYDQIPYLRLLYGGKTTTTEYAFGVKAKTGIECIYSLTNHISVFGSADIAILWSTIFRNSGHHDWVVKGIDGYEREVRLNSMVYGLNAGVVIALTRN